MFLAWCWLNVSFLFLSFAVFICSFMVAAPIFGYLGDRFNRKIILSCGIFFWSAVTFSSSFITEQVRSLERCFAGCPEKMDNMYLKKIPTSRDSVLKGNVSLWCVFDIQHVALSDLLWVKCALCNCVFLTVKAVLWSCTFIKNNRWSISKQEFLLT